MRLFQIEYLKAVGEHGSISKAAEELNISRTAVSKALRELENEYGVRLFIRSISGIALTEPGCELYKKCNEIQKMIDNIQNEMSIYKENAKRESQKRLKVGLLPATGFAVFPDFCAKINEQYPDIVIEPKELPYKQAMLMLEEGSIDMCLSYIAVHEDRFSSIDIKQMELFFCCNVNHRLAQKKSVNIDDFKNEPLIQMESDYYQGVSGRFSNMFHQRGLPLPIKFATTQASMARNMVARGLCCSAQFRDVMDGDPKIVLLPFDDPIIYPVCVLWNDTVKHSAMFYKIIEGLRSINKNT